MSNKLTFEEQEVATMSHVKFAVETAVKELSAYTRTTKNRNTAIALTKIEECLMWLKNGKNPTLK